MSYPQVSSWTDDSFFLATAPFLISKHIEIRGIMHLGAHTCEEKKEYNTAGIPDEQILWIEGNKELCEQNKKNGIQNMYNALISDTEKDVVFHITNNMASSSLFPLSAHKALYPHILEVETRKEKAISLPTFFTTYSLDPRNYNIWNLDIQGGELDALKGAGDLLNNVDILFTEVNFKKMYEDIPLAHSLIDFLREKGFTLTHVKEWQNCWGDALFVRNKYL